ncbi:MAG: DUF3737 family protein [Bacilli bacterium]|nr:DUF3737 family protein [Bacilli bacterium]
MKNVIENQTYSKERSLYNISNTSIINCSFLPLNDDGESPLKECENIEVINSNFSLRYALWHDDGLTLNNVVLNEPCRAPLWYSKNITMNKSSLLGVKGFRECDKISINFSKLISPEVFWRCDRINVNSSEITSEYGFFLSKNIQIDSLTFKGKYSFQYVENMNIRGSNFDTKDAFWHSKNVTIENSIIKGEYLGWYSEGLTLINCAIISHQPLCYCKNLKLVNCKMKECDLAFEYSEVDASIIGSIGSIKNPKSGRIVVGSVGQIVKEDDKYVGNAEIIVGKR